ncbi:uncharacterized protein B0H18DRAFT_62605 [Fomitopsis serialis]|uniref:uncharacterized protein n=1 Tax=Fomitopsis serialis TaxID=139415 RepID=UPI002007AB5A|nr:uncharacterized protein B0H18DRAFT_62605 [Neoantrodia serialis]KAH9916692.1 hypothetical protein B0H18DRAFT_62605 [Neoantrodia serialis]
MHAAWTRASGRRARQVHRRDAQRRLLARSPVCSPALPYPLANASPPVCLHTRTLANSFARMLVCLVAISLACSPAHSRQFPARLRLLADALACPSLPARHLPSCSPSHSLAQSLPCSRPLSLAFSLALSSAHSCQSTPAVLDALPAQVLLSSLICKPVRQFTCPTARLFACPPVRHLSCTRFLLRATLLLARRARDTHRYTRARPRTNPHATI